METGKVRVSCGSETRCSSSHYDIRHQNPDWFAQLADAYELPRLCSRAVAFFKLKAKGDGFDTRSARNSAMRCLGHLLLSAGVRASRSSGGEHPRVI